MFTGIIEELGILREIENEGSNVHLTIASKLTPELKVDQSVAHNGICLTVTEIIKDRYKVTAVQETVEKTNIGHWVKGDKINLERGIRLSDRLDGHLVQGHVDATGQVLEVEERSGSWIYKFQFPKDQAGLMIPKGSITINGVSLTVIDPDEDSFSVTIIPYTYEHTTFHQLQVGDAVNLEFDLIGKYFLRNMRLNSEH
ncbi:MAG TPA: riboflavin synthase [Saprospiraceae bacterium]|nr:riboflavin synthase [Saprospiraceae bacterium]